MNIQAIRTRFVQKEKRNLRENSLRFIFYVVVVLGFFGDF